jgi:hypothetical protein
MAPRLTMTATRTYSGRQTYLVAEQASAAIAVGRQYSHAGSRLCAMSDPDDAEKHQRGDDDGKRDELRQTGEDDAHDDEGHQDPGPP